MFLNFRHPRIFTAICALFFLWFLFYLHGGHSLLVPSTSSTRPHTPSTADGQLLPAPVVEEVLIVDNFPLAAAAHTSADIPPIPSWNTPPSPHVAEKTPLFIGFTRNWHILQQCVVSYLTAGWPASDIYVIENTGVLDSNEQGRLSMQNPFFLNHTRLNLLGVQVIRTPVLLTFAQLQNFYLHTAVEEKYPTFFWSHMDVAALSVEDGFATEADRKSYKSLYTKAVDVLREATTPDPATKKVDKWGMKTFSYDHLALFNTEAFIELGGWDTQIPFYHSDCDMYGRMIMAGYSREERNVGRIFDVLSSVDDLSLFYRKNANVAADDIDSIAYKDLVRALENMQYYKNSDNGNHRNTWQGKLSQGQGEPFYRDGDGFDTSLRMHTENGRMIFWQKWGYRWCDIVGQGLTLEDAWKPKSDWWQFWRKIQHILSP